MYVRVFVTECTITTACSMHLYWISTVPRVLESNTL